MRRILICTGVLGGGTALTFAASALAATLLPGGTVIPSSMVTMGWAKGGVTMPAPAPMVAVPPSIDISGGGSVGVDVAVPPTPAP